LSEKEIKKILVDHLKKIVYEPGQCALFHPAGFESKGRVVTVIDGLVTANFPEGIKTFRVGDQHYSPISCDYQLL